QAALGVGLHDQVELLRLALLGPPRQLLERHPGSGMPGTLLGAALLLLGQSYLAGGLLGPDHLEDVSGARHLAHPADHHWHGWRRLADVLTAVVAERSRTAEDVAADEVVPDAQGPVPDRPGR